ncbi:pupal cuticle protein 36-like [Zerene cesonia]|uniref:pupal cuticle protein 36-like n=1 Tax=Zerene cesonia TaxID=33412 RepID=UPI0018E54388|nr:pupal cuticle protein 36-like [Zerene cesonia]
MKLFIVLAMVALSSGDKLDNTYLPPSHAQSSGGGNFLDTPNFGLRSSDSENFGPSNTNGQYNAYDNSQADVNGDVNNYNTFGRQERTQAAFERNAAILRQDNVNNGDSYSYAFETENGITAEENGVATNGVEAQGGFSYIGDDGVQYSIRYTADQNGFRPEGDHLPTPPPIPAEILKALEQNARDEAAGIYDDGSYSEGKYDNDFQPEGNYGNYNDGLNVNTINNIPKNDDDTVVTDSAAFTNPQNGVPEQDFQNPLVTGAKTYLPPRAGRRYRY